MSSIAANEETGLSSLAGHWERYTAMYDRMNEPLPERYQKRLEDRFYPRLLEGGDRSESR